MKIIKCSIFRFVLPLKQPLLLSGQLVRERVGLLLKLTDSSSRIGWGEIAPLPGFSVETYQEAVEDLKRLNKELTEFDFSNIDITKNKPLAHLKLTRSVQFGLEMAMLNLITPFDRQADDISVSVNGLIVKLDRAATGRAKELATLGYKAIKIKIGRTNIETETKLIREISENLPNDVTLRLDGNQSMTLNEAIRFCHEVENCKIEYIEEPLSNHAELKELARQTSIRFALDETLVAALNSKDNISAIKLLEPDSIVAMVIKPTLVGGIHESLRLAALARQTGTKVVISSAYESSLGLAQLVELAKLVEPHGVHGLATLDVFESHLTTETLALESGQLIRPNSFSHTPDLTLIEELTYE